MAKMIPTPPPRPPLDLSIRGSISERALQAPQPIPTDLAPYQPPQDPGEPVKPAPLIGQELSLSLESYYSRFELYQYKPDVLLNQKGFQLLEKMSTTDDTISMCLNALKMMRLSSGYRIVEASPDPLDIQIADEVADNFDQMLGSLREKLFSIFGSLDMGWSLHEKIWGHWDQGPLKGHVRLVTLKSKNPQWFNPTVDDFNNITGLAMISPPAFGRKLPHQKFVIYSAQKRYENVFGTARIRCLYDVWYMKGLAKSALTILTKNYGRDIPMGFYPMTMSAADKSAFLTAMTNLASSAALMMPEGTKVEFAHMDFKTIEGCLAIIEKADQQMTKVLLGQVISTGTSSGQAHKGGQSQGSGGGGGAGGRGAGVQEKTLTMYLDYMGADVAENPLQDIIKEIVDYNYEGVTRYPKFEFKPLDEEDNSAAVGAWVTAATAGVVTSSSDDEEHMREVLGFPSVNGKTTLRPNRYKTRATMRVIEPHRPIDPRSLPQAGYRPPTPSAPGLPANYAESDDMPKPSREMTQYEKHVDFAESWRILDTDGEDVIAGEAAKVIRKAVEKLKLDAKKALGDSGKIKKLTMPYRSELADVLGSGLTDVAKKAMRQAKHELFAKGAAPIKAKVLNLGEIHDFGRTPDDVLKLIDDRSFTMAGDISDEVLKRVKQVMYNGVKTGDSYKDVVYNIEEQIAPYIDLSQSADATGARLMTAIRTNVSAAYTDARKAIFEEPDLEGFVVAYQYSAVLDDRTTEWCAAMDKKIFKVSNPIWDDWTPPTFFNCRSVLIPITQADGWDGEESEEPTDEPPGGFN